MNGVVQSGDVVRVKLPKMLLYPLVLTLIFLAGQAVFATYKSVSAGERYTQDEAERDNEAHNRRLCALEARLFEERLWDCPDRR